MVKIPHLGHPIDPVAAESPQNLMNTNTYNLSMSFMINDEFSARNP